MRWPHYLVLLALLAAVAWLVLETRQLAELAGDFERRARLAERDLSAQREASAAPAGDGAAGDAADERTAEQAPAPAVTEAPVDLSEYTRLQLELHATQEQLTSLRALLEERSEERATRFAAIYHSDIPDLVGPIRSARTTDLDLLTNLGTPDAPTATPPRDALVVLFVALL